MSMGGGQYLGGHSDLGQTVASFPQYELAQKAVSTLIAADIPAREIAIVGQGVRSVERVTGRLGYATAARSGAINGLLLGLLFSAIFVIGSDSVPVQAFVGVLFVGIAIGMLASLATFAIVRRRRDFASVMQFVADHYDVNVTAASAGRARQVLGPQAAATPEPASRPTPVHAAEPLEPPKYGQRIGDTPAPPEAEPAADETDSGASAAPEDRTRED